MVAYSFKKRFGPPILAGTKAQTIRADRKRHARQGEELNNCAANGVCPYCNRSFANLRQLMATQHPQCMAEEIAHA